MISPSGRSERGSIAKLIALKSIVCKIVLEQTCLGVEARQAVIGSYPQATIRMALNGTNTIIG